MPDVVLTTLPFATLEAPSIALGILKASLQSAGVSCQVHHANLDFAHHVGLDSYLSLRGVRNDDLLGEWIFSGVAFPDFHPDSERYFELVLWRRSNLDQEQVQTLQQHARAMREAAGRFIEHTARRILELKPRIVGCSSVFMQQCASLALLRRIRELDPGVITLLGGANCEGFMGVKVAQSFPWVDYVVSGEADLLIVDLCQLLLEKGKPEDPRELPYGVIDRRVEFSPQAPPRARVQEMDKVPMPDYSDYFRDLSGCNFAALVQPGLFLESSRGCWWGQVHHCTFCGLNGHGMNYRSKTGEKVVAMFTEMTQRHQLKSFVMVDNIIDTGYFQTVLPELARTQDGFTIFFETKANLKREQLEMMLQAGVNFIQAGIESLHSQVLKLMDKGTTTMINLAMLKWCRELGIHNYWNILYNFPGEEESWYAEMLEWIPSLVHLQAPQGLFPVRYDRFSPHYNQPEKYGLDLVPNVRYAYIYPFAEEQLAGLAYYFQERSHAEQERQQRTPVFPLTPIKEKLNAAVKDWHHRFWQNSWPAILSMSERPEGIELIDTRPCAVQRRTLLVGRQAAIYQACGAPVGARSLLQQLQEAGYPCTLAELQPDLDLLIQQRFLFQADQRWLALATRGNLPRLPRPGEWPGGRVAWQQPDAKVASLT